MKELNKSVLLYQLKFTEEYEQSKGKGSFPAMITPGYQAAKQANTLASNVRWFSVLACFEQIISKPSSVGDCVSVLDVYKIQPAASCFLSLQLEYKKGHEERVCKYTTFVDPPEVLLAKKQGQIVSDVSFSLRFS